MTEEKKWNEKIPQEMTDADVKAMWDECYSGIDKANKEIRRRNNRLLKVLQKAKGTAYIKNLQQLLKDCEVGRGEYEAPLEISRSRYGQYQSERYGKHIRGYWVDQHAVGDSGDSWEGYIYVELKPGRYLKVRYSI